MAKNTNCDTEVSRGAAVATTGDENQPRNDEKKKKQLTRTKQSESFAFLHDENKERAKKKKQKETFSNYDGRIGKR